MVFVVQKIDEGIVKKSSSKCSFCGPKELQKARELQRRLEEELLTAHGKIQDLEVSRNGWVALGDYVAPCLVCLVGAGEASPTSPTVQGVQGVQA